MKAAYITKYGGAENIQYGDMEDPVCRENEIVVKTIGASVNNVDTFIRSGKYRTPIPFPFVVGRDMVGIVQEVGKATEGFKIGDMVWTNSMGHEGRQGVTSEFASIPQERLYHLPSGVDPISAVASVHSSATAAILLTQIGNARIGERVLVHGAAGHVGTKLVSLAHQMGLSVTTTSSPDDFAKLHSLGADSTFNYKEKITQQNTKGFDLVVDTSGHVDLQDNITVLSTGGRILMIAPAPVNTVDTWPLYTKPGSILGFVISHATIEQLKIASEIINVQFKKGLLLGDVICKLPFSKAAEAHNEQEKPGKKKPKYVLVTM
jgi:NADPH:quinone reductase-like Zn-dependent oxidoreductase